MSDKIKNVIISIMFLTIIIGVFFVNLITKDKQISVSERRKLKQFPVISLKNIFEGQVSDELEDYAMDQFVCRDEFRKIKAFTNFKILFQKDTNGLFIENDSIYKQTGSLKTSEIEKATNKFNNIQSKLLENCNVYFSIIPDKNYYLKDNDLRMDYEKLEEIMKTNLSNMQYINLFSILDENDYYKTDIHWKQENLCKVAELIANTMQTNINLENIQVKSKGDFYGVYAGQLGLNQKLHDELKYITSEIIDSSTTFNIETNEEGLVYDEKKLATSSDKYDYFVSGATPLITITNPLAETTKELIIFRDSFASSLAPLLLEGYKKITLVDIRYMSSDYLENYIDFNNKDVLFLYNVLILNDASMLR